MLEEHSVFACYSQHACLPYCMTIIFYCSEKMSELCQNTLFWWNINTWNYYVLLFWSKKIHFVCFRGISTLHISATLRISGGICLILLPYYYHSRPHVAVHLLTHSNAIIHKLKHIRHSWLLSRDRREVLYYVTDIVTENIRWKIPVKSKYHLHRHC